MIRFLRRKKIEEVRIINKKQTQSTQSIFLCRDVDLQQLGREVYADNVETPYSFYLIRKLNLAKDYQSLAEGEAFFEAIRDSWDETTEFDALVVKKIYLYVETEIMYYTVLFGSFEPVTKSVRIKLKEWIASVSINRVDRPLVHNGALTTNNEELKSMMKQLLETSNEIFRLRKIINDFNDNLSVAKIETSLEPNPVISRSIRTIHLKRAQPFVLNEEESTAKELSSISGVLAERTGGKEPKKVAVEAFEESFQSTVSPRRDVTGKKSELEAAEKQVLIPDETPNNEDLEVLDSALKKDSEKIKSTKLKLDAPLSKGALLTENTSHKSSYKKKNAKKIVKAKPASPFDYKRCVIKKRNIKKIQPTNWSLFSKQLVASKKMYAVNKIARVSRAEMEDLEDKIYLHFMNKRIRTAAKKNQTQKKSISRTDLLVKIGQAEYLNYSWAQVFKQRKADVLICGRLSSANLVAALDDFLYEMREIAYSRSLFGQKVRCSTDRLRRLEGYILMDKYMQKLSFSPIDFEEKKGYF